MGSTTLVSPEGQQTAVPDEQVADYLRQGFRAASAQDVATANAQAAREASVNPVESIVQGGLRGATLGLSDVAQRALGGDEAARRLTLAKEAHPILSTVGEVGGAVVPALLTGGESVAGTLADMTPIGRVSALGSRVAALGENAGAIGRIGAKAAGGAVEGGLIGTGQGVSELALDDRPITWERAASVLSSNALFGVALGGGAGILGGAIDEGLGKLKGAVDKEIAARAAAPTVDAELADLDVKGLAKARDAEVDSIKTARATERQSIVDDLGTLRQDLKEQKLWLATKGAEEPELRSIGKVTLRADRKVDTLLDNPKALERNPVRALDALETQETALQKLANKSDELRAKFAADTTGERAATLDNLPKALERNRALQERIRSVTSEPTSRRLQAIADAKEALQTPTSKGLLDGINPGTAVGGFVGHAVGGPVGTFVGAKVGDALSSFVTKKLAKATAGQLQATGKAVDAMMTGNRAIGKVRTPLATRVLGRVSFGEPQAGAGDGQKGDLGKLYAQRSAELRRLTYYDENGENKMRPDARAAMADRLSPIRHVAPVAADRLETNAARRLETYAATMPRLPDVGAPVGGPDTRRPSDFAIRGWARVIAVGENPAAFERRMCAGKATPEECAAYARIYPERKQELTSQIMTALPARKEKLPYAKRLVLSMFTGQPIDPTMHPIVLQVTQASFRAEPGSAGGTMAPKPMPQFGSVKKSTEQPTPGQKRGQGT